MSPQPHSAPAGGRAALGVQGVERTERRGDYVLKWREPQGDPEKIAHEWSVEVSTDYPGLLAKLGRHPRCFTADTCECALAEARGFVDSLSLP